MIVHIWRVRIDAKQITSKTGLGELTSCNRRDARYQSGGRRPAHTASSCNSTFSEWLRLIRREIEMTARDFLATPTAEVTASAAPASETGRLRPIADLHLLPQHMSWKREAGRKSPGATVKRYQTIPEWNPHYVTHKPYPKFKPKISSKNFVYFICHHSIRKWVFNSFKYQRSVALEPIRRHITTP